VRSIDAGVRVYHSFSGYEERAPVVGVVAFKLRQEDVPVRPQGITVDDLNNAQVRYWEAGKASIDRAVAFMNSTSSDDAARILRETTARIAACFGPPGSGKTAVTHLLIEYALDQDGEVLFALPTAQLASRMREKYADHPRRDQIGFDTCHAAFGLGEEFVNAPTLAGKQLVVIDEVSQLQGTQNDCIIGLWHAADEVPAILEIGDKCQMAGFGETRPWHTNMWAQRVFVTELHEAFRCKDPKLKFLLDMIRQSMPTDGDWGWIEHNVLRQQKAWFPHDEPMASDIGAILEARPNTKLLACTRKGQHHLNCCAVEALFGKEEPLVVLPGDIENNPENYDAGHKLFKEKSKLQFLDVPIFVGMKLFITQNVNKEDDFVNGMECVVDGYDPSSRAIEVTTRTGKALSIWRWSNRNLHGLAYYPIRQGYASTILKFQGAELEAVDVWLDAAIAGAAYTAISRVSYMKDVHIGGHVNKYHFKPAN